MSPLGITAARLLLGATAATCLAELKAGVKAEQAGDDRTASQWLERAASDAPRWPLAKIELAQLRLKLGQSREARKLAGDAVFLDPYVPRGWHLLSLADEAVGDTPGSEAAERRAVSLRPDYPEAKQHLAQLLWNEGKKEEALQLYAGLAAGSPRDATLLALLATAQEEAGHFADAEQTLRRLEKLQPESPAWHRRLAQLLEREGKSSDADAETKKLARLSGRREKARHLRPLLPSRR